MLDGVLGRTIAGKYQIESLLGSGAMGRVFRARHTLIDRAVAIKVVASNAANRLQGRAWFLREARAVNRVRHPNIVEIHDFGETSDGLAYLVMELLAGDRLCDRANGRPMGAAFVLNVISQVGSALSRAHGLGVVHRDLKPEHVFLVSHGGRPDYVKLIDFGLARMSHEARLAARGSVFGTPAYMSPEQARGEEATPQSDLYSLGVVVFEMMTGMLPFRGDDPDAQLECHRSVPPPDPAELCAGLDPELCRITTRLLAKDLSVRYRDAHHLLEHCMALQRRLGGPPGPDPHADFRLTGPAQSPATGGDDVTAIALRASLFGRMASTAYPGGHGPHPIVDAVDTMWTTAAELSRIEGELEVIATWDDNLRRRAREFATEVGRKTEEVSRLQSLLQRDIDHAERELAQLRRRCDETARRLDDARSTLGQVEEEAGDASRHTLLQDAARAAAEHQRLVDALGSHTLELEKKQLSRNRYERLLNRHRDTLDAHNRRIESELDARRPRLETLAQRRDRLRTSVREVERTLRSHFRGRPECRGLFRQLRSLDGPPVDPESTTSGAS